MLKKLSSNDKGYQSGALSVFPNSKDSKLTLHEARNNVEDSLRQTLAINSKYIILNDATSFPNSGIIKITPKDSQNLLDNYEVIFYARKIGNQLHMLQRGYSGSSPNTWPAGSKVSCPIMAEHHNAIKDAILKIQKKIGLEENPSSDSVNGVLKYLENKWLMPKPVFKAYPKFGAAPLTVTFHNFSTGPEARYLWDFGDGNTSTEANPIHIYQTEDKYNVKLSMIGLGGAVGFTEKTEYVNVTNAYRESWFHYSPLQGKIGTEFEFVDQSDGHVMERHWYFGDGEDQTVKGTIHSVKHVYAKSGNFKPILVLRMLDNTTKRVSSGEGIVIDE